MDCVPRFSTPRSSNPTRGAYVARVAEVLGKPLQPWQRHVVDVVNEFDPETGFPTYRGATVVVPRQCGKTVWLFAEAVDRCLVWPRGLEDFADLNSEEFARQQRVVTTAQSAHAASQKLWVDLYEGMIRPSPLVKTVDRLYKGSSAPALHFTNGSRLQISANTRTAVHGQTVDLALQDELFADEDFTRMQALVPAQVSLDCARALSASTMGDSKSVVLNAEVRAGRVSTRAGTCQDRGVAYFEWSAPDDSDRGEPRVWARCIPGIEGGVTSLRAVRYSQEKMPGPEFDRAFLNRVPESLESAARMIPHRVWEGSKVSGAEVGDEGVVALEADLDLTGVWALACNPLGDVGLLEVTTVAGMLEFLGRLLDGTQFVVVVDSKGPLAPWCEDLRMVAAKHGARARLLFTQGEEMLGWCMDWFVSLLDAKTRIVPFDGIDEAAANAAKRQVGDRWTWRRELGGHLLVAASLAHGARRRKRTVVKPRLEWVA